MKKIVLMITMMSALFAFVGCDSDIKDQMSSNYPTDYDIKYGIGHVRQYDPMNIKGIDIAERLDFFSSLRLTIHVVNSEIVALTYSNGDIPFSPYDFEVPEGRFDCVLDKSVLPNELRIKGTNNVIALFKNGEFVVPFQLDSKSLSYEYTFKSVE